MRAAAVDGRIGPGNIPAIWIGRGAWALNGWKSVSEPDAPAQPVYQGSGSGFVKDLASTYIKVKAGQVLAWSAWVRATTLGTTASWGTFLALTCKLENESLAYPSLAGWRINAYPTKWTLVRGFWTVPAGYTRVLLRATLRNEHVDGTYQVCGLQLSIIGAMPVP